MRVAGLYDIHGNLPALEAVLEEVRQARVDLIVIGGDVFPGPMPVETIKFLLRLDIPVRFILGNGDREVLALMRGLEPSKLPESAILVLRWVAEQLSAEHERLIAGWPATTRAVAGEAGEVLFCHATPGSDTEIFTRDTPEAQLMNMFEGVDAGVVVCGHTHMQFDRMIGTTRVVNAGSVGMPFGEPGAYWLLLDSKPTLRRTEYDLAAAADLVRRTRYPQAEDFAVGNILRPPSEAQMLKVFSKA